MNEGTRSSTAPDAALLALAEALVPPGQRVPGADASTVDAALRLVAEAAGSKAVRAVTGLARILDAASRVVTGVRLRDLDSQARERLLQRWAGSRAGLPLLGLGALFKMARLDDADVYGSLGCVFDKSGTPEPVRWTQQVRSPHDLAETEVVECDAVVVGTGAGGAVAGFELADRGLAVAFVEEGLLRRRDEFTGRAAEAHRKFYRHGTLAVGNTVMPVFMGRLVGGSTAVNTATCFRTPPWVLEEWCEELGSDELSPERMRPHFDRVESHLRVGLNDARHVGAVAAIVARGCDALGWRHGPIRRNAPDCDGQGVCDFGCPTDAKRSTNISYVPPALERGALLFTGVRAGSVLVEGGRAVGIRGRTADGRTLVVRARAVVLAGGAISTPLLLLRQGIANSSGQVGRNLSLHPSTAAGAVFDEVIEGYNRIPQGYCSDEFHREGILLLGAQPTIDTAGAFFPLIGRQFAELMDSFDRVTGFGVLVRDATRNGRVRPGPGGRTLITYRLTSQDVVRLQRGLGLVAEMFFAAGAHAVFPLVPRMPRLESTADLDRFRTVPLRARDFLLTSWHPVGTCQMGTDPMRSVVGLDNQSHDVSGLYITDASVIPGPPAVNSQITVMAFAGRAAEHIAATL